MRYKPWGETRYSWTSETLTSTPTYEMTKYQFTGQFSYEAEFGLLFYNARMYDPYLTHFTQPDSIVPDPYNSQDWDRYAYARNNPIRYTDPSGHCAVVCLTALIGASVGAIGGAFLGAGTYVVTTAVSGREFNVGDYRTSVATGAIGGSLIGAGIGLANKHASPALIGGGDGVLAAQIGYSITAGEDFDGTELTIASTVGGASGATKGLLYSTGVGGAAAGPVVDGVAGATQYAATQVYNGHPVDSNLAVQSMSVGLASAGISGLIGEGVQAFSGGSSSQMFGSHSQMWINTAANTNNWLGTTTTSYIAHGAFYAEAASEFTTSVISEAANSLYMKYMR